MVESLKKGMYGTPDKKRTAFQLGMCGREVGRGGGGRIWNGKTDSKPRVRD